MSIKNKLAAVACGLALVGTVAAPVAALADGGASAGVADNTGSTVVKVMTDPSDTQLTFSVPAEIDFAVDATGELTGPSPSAIEIVNKSVFPIHVTKMEGKAEGQWNLSTAADAASLDNVLTLKIGPSADNEVELAASTDLQDNDKWNLGYRGSNTDTINLKTAGSVARVNQDISNKTKVATITWTLAAGNA